MNNEQNLNNAPDEEIGESIAAKRLGMRGAPSAPPPPDFEPEDERSPFRRKFDNFWYHYKWHTIAAICLVLILAITVPQCLFRKTYDAYILYAGPMTDCGSGDTMGHVQSSLMGLGMPDYNSDGDRSVMFRPILLFTEEQLENMGEDEKNMTLPLFLSENRNLFSNELMAGECYICLLDPAIFADLREEGWIVNMNEILSPDEIPENDYGDFGVTLSTTDFGRYFVGFNAMPKDTVLCFRYMALTADMADKEASSVKRKNAIDLFRRMVTFSSLMG